jgi:DNA repair exonuclease SbcCD ATPase subunit
MSDLLSHFESQIQNQEQLLREREQELEQLRRQHDRLAELTRQRDELQAQLRAVESDIALIERTMSSSLHRFGNRYDGTAPASSSSAVIAQPAARVVPEPPPPADSKPTTLKEEIRKVLRTARTPLSCEEIAEKIRAGGYKTSSANFTDIVKKRLHEMTDVSFARGQGYRLKK